MSHIPTLNRRQALQRASLGFGGLALSALLNQQSASAESKTARNLPKGCHHQPTAKSVIFLYMDGGVSQVDSFDPKPRLDKENGKPFPAKTEPTQFNNKGNTLASPWKFHQRGESGLPISDLFPHMAQCADDLAVIRSMTSNFSEHTNANYFLHTGHGLAGRPSMGAWATYGLGQLSENLPGFIVLNGGLIPPGGLDNIGSGFLPASFQGSLFQPTGTGVANIKPAENVEKQQHEKLELMKMFDREFLETQGKHDAVESAMVNYELAFRMQKAVPSLMDLTGESNATKKLYGLDSNNQGTQIFARECLLARRMIERGVRFVQLTCPNVKHDRWDQHNNLKQGHRDNALAVDQPIAGLLKDLKSRGLLDETLVVWSGEFGRTPFAQGKNGRDHNPYGFSLWMAGGGVKGGVSYGRTDEFGYRAIENRLMIHDLHATILHCLGIDHEKLTYRFSGRDMRLTDVHGHVVHDILS